MTTSDRARLLEAEQGKPLAAILQDAWRAAPSYRRCAAWLHIAPGTLQRWMRQEGLRPSQNPLRPGLVKRKEKP